MGENREDVLKLKIVFSLNENTPPYRVHYLSLYHTITTYYLLRTNTEIYLLHSIILNIVIIGPYYFI